MLITIVTKNNLILARVHSFSFQKNFQLRNIFIKCYFLKFYHSLQLYEIWPGFRSYYNLSEKIEKTRIQEQEYFSRIAWDNQIFWIVFSDKNFRFKVFFAADNKNPFFRPLSYRYFIIETKKSHQLKCQLKSDLKAIKLKRNFIPFETIISSWDHGKIYNEFLMANMFLTQFN